MRITKYLSESSVVNQQRDSISHRAHRGVLQSYQRNNWVYLSLADLLALILFLPTDSSDPTRWL